MCPPTQFPLYQTLKLPTAIPVVHHKIGSVSEEKQKEIAVLSPVAKWLTFVRFTRMDHHVSS